MAIIGTIRARAALLVRSERGMALPVALFAMISSMALAGAAGIAPVDVQRGPPPDNSSKSAIAAADAGANTARQRLARYAYVLDAEPAPCLSIGTGGLLTASAAETVGGSSWCPPVSGTVGGATYSYRATPIGSTCGEYSLCVVSTGTASGVSRRIEVTFKSESSSGSSGSSGEKKEVEPGSTWSSGVGIDGV